MEKRKKMEKITIHQGILILFAAAAGSVELAQSVKSAIGASVFSPLYIAGMIVSVLFWLPYILSKKKKGTILIGIFPLVCLSVFAHEQMKTGLLEKIGVPLIKSLDCYFIKGSQVPEAAVQIPDMDYTFGLLFLSMLLICLYVFLWGKKGGKGIAVIMIVMILVLPFFVGKVINTAGTAAAGTAVCLMLMPEQRKEKCDVLTGMILSLFLGIILSKGLVNQVFQHPIPVWDYMDRMLRYREGDGGISDGQLGTVDAVKESGEKQLEITLSDFPERTVYLRGYVGVDYDENTWKKSRDTGGLTSGELRRERKREYNTALQNADQYDWQVLTAKIKRLYASGKYAYLPYKNNADLTYYGDLYAQEEKKTYEMDIVLAQELASMDRNPAYDSVQDEDEMEYAGAVQETCRKVPDALKNRLQSMAVSVDGSSVQSIAVNIRSLLESMAEYTKSPGRTPQNEDFITWFLENKKGYCVHFASVGVMLFRMNGIPARFVSGYVAKPGQFQAEEEGGYKAVIDDSMAHAWPEVYVEGVGWLPVEVTPVNWNETTQNHPEHTDGSTEVQRIPNRTEETEIPGNQQSEKPEVSQKTEKTDMKKEAQKTASDPILMAGVMTVFLSLGILILFLLKERKWKKQKKMRKMEGQYLSMYRFLYEIVAWENGEKELPEEAETFAEILWERYCIPIGESRELLEKVFEIVYGNGYATSNQQRKLWNICVQVRRQVYSNVKFRKKIIFLYKKGF